MGTTDDQRLELFSPSEVQDSEMKYGDELSGISALRLTASERPNHPLPSTSSPVIDRLDLSTTISHNNQIATDACQPEERDHSAMGNAARGSTSESGLAPLTNSPNRLTRGHEDHGIDGEKSGLGEHRIVETVVNSSDYAPTTPAPGSLDPAGDKGPEEAIPFERGLGEHQKMETEARSLDNLTVTPHLEHLDLVDDERLYPPDSPRTEETDSLLQTRLLSISADQSTYLNNAKVKLILPDLSQKAKKPPSRSKQKPSSKEQLPRPTRQLHKPAKEKKPSSSKAEAQEESGSDGSQGLDTAAQIYSHLQAALDPYSTCYKYDNKSGKATKLPNAIFTVGNKRSSLLFSNAFICLTRVKAT
jgi:hypothetical protein